MIDVWQNLLFGLLGGLVIVSSIAVVATQNIVRCAAWLLLSLCATAGLFFLLGANFVGATQLLIYVGGTLVLVVFGVMLTAQGPFVNIKAPSGDWVVASVVSIALLFVLYGTLVYPWPLSDDGADWPVPDNTIGVVSVDQSLLDELEAGPVTEALTASLSELSITLTQEAELESVGNDWVIRDATSGSGYALVAEASGEEDSQVRVTVLPFDQVPDSTKLALAFLQLAPQSTDGSQSQGDPASVGYLLPFEIVSVHLLVVLIGAAYLARAKKRRAS